MIENLSKIDINEIKNESDSELKELFSIFKLKVDLINDKKVDINSEVENRIRDNFKIIKLECQSRFHVSEFPMQVIFENGSQIDFPLESLNSARGLTPIYGPSSKPAKWLNDMIKQNPDYYKDQMLGKF